VFRVLILVIIQILSQSKQKPWKLINIDINLTQYDQILIPFSVSDTVVIDHFNTFVIVSMVTKPGM